MHQISDNLTPVHTRNYYIVNAITLYRLVAAACLILLVIYKSQVAFKWLLLVSFMTDAVDGYLARRLHVVSRFGVRLDSIADDFTIVAAITGMIVFKRDFLNQQIMLLIILFCLYVLQTVLAFIRYGKLSGFHTYVAKIAAIFQGLFLLTLFFYPEPVYPLYYAATCLTMIDLIEETILVLLLPQWKTDVKGIFWVIKKAPYQTIKNGMVGVDYKIILPADNQ